MLLECFNCPSCSRPFQIRPHNQYDPHIYSQCQNGHSVDRLRPVHLNPLLEQPNVKRTRHGWVAVGPLIELTCEACSSPLDYPPPLNRCCRFKLLCRKCFDFNYLCDRCKLPEESVSVLIKYMALAKKVRDAIEKLAAFSEPGMAQKPTCTRCQKRLGPPKNRLVVACSSVFCPECYYETDMKKECHLCELPFSMHVYLSQALSDPDIGKGKNSRVKKEITKEQIPANLSEEITAKGSDEKEDEVEPLQLEKKTIESTEDLMTPCQGCGEEALASKMFSCVNCNNSILCGTCSVRQHRTHELVDVGSEKLKKLEQQTMEAVAQQYDGLKGMVIHIHEKIAENMKRLAEEAVENSKMISEQNVYADGLSISDTLREKANAFERHFEEYLPLARIYNEKLTDLADENQALIRQFKKGLAIAESPEKNEEAEVSTRSDRDPHDSSQTKKRKKNFKKPE